MTRRIVSIAIRIWKEISAGVGDKIHTHFSRIESGWNRTIDEYFNGCAFYQRSTLYSEGCSIREVRHKCQFSGNDAARLGSGFFSKKQ
ncbi:hypothetical protein A167_03126 [Alcanivorax sp. S71-1-4]|nr:hypothetical protein A167_03126 [Alcanivorax sp. S71-1-4]